MNSVRDIVEEEMIYGAQRREALWKRIAFAGMVFGFLGFLSTILFVMNDVDPPPVVVPFDPATGMALPNAMVKSVTITEEDAVVEAAIFSYVSDREVYNQVDNDLRIRSVLERSSGNAETTLREIWSSDSELYPPTLYGQGRLDVKVLGITRIGTDRGTVRLQKRLSAASSSKTGFFTATLKFEFRPEERRRVDDVWNNPFGFTVTEYAIRSDRLETDQ